MERLDKLSYPPFAVVVEPPYVPILPGMWPPPEPEEGEEEEKEDSEEVENTATTVKENILNGGGGNSGKDREMEILKQQWGDQGVTVAATAQKSTAANDNNEESPATTSNSIKGRHVNLFDGRVLAYYLVSTLQFIDPYNRRDLTRLELQALDTYLSIHKLGNAGVAEAYDEKGVTLSTAGSAAHTASGRVQILQEEARSILGSLYRNRDGAQQQQPQLSRRQRQRQQQQVDAQQHSMRGNEQQQQQQQQQDETANSFQRMYISQQQGGSSQLSGQRHQHLGTAHDTGIYEGEGGGGLLIIDDDINPGLRSRVPPTGVGGDGSSTLYSARHIAERHSQAAQVQENNFPSLATTAVSIGQGTTSTQQPPSAAAATGRPSKSLNKISKLVSKTDQKQVEKQRKAREEAQRRAELSKLNYFNPETASGTSVLGTMSVPLSSKQPPSEALLERNRNLAAALGVAPSTVRNEIALTGWARPVSAVDTSDEFSKELNAAQYPDSLLAEAKERMNELLKLEKQWKRFLSDDRDASCSLKPMARPLRKFVHEYGDFWKLHTESFDPEGRRYIYCKKQLDTCAPYPMLSEAARKWRGPTIGPASGDVDISSLPTGPSAANAALAQPTERVWLTEERVKLKLVPRTLAVGAAQPHMPESMGMHKSTSTPTLSMMRIESAPRFTDLCDKERPKIVVAPRSIPMWDELEKRNITQTEWKEMTEEQQAVILREVDEANAKKAAQIQQEKEKEAARVQRLKNKAKKKEAAAVKKKTLLENAFASDSDDDGSDSDWFESELVEFDDDE